MPDPDKAREELRVIIDEFKEFCEANGAVSANILDRTVSTAKGQCLRGEDEKSPE